MDAHQLERSTDITGATTCDPDSNRIMLYQSTNQGTTWKSKDITLLPSRYRYAWLAISPDGSKLGVGLYYTRNSDTDPWKVVWRHLQPVDEAATGFAGRCESGIHGRHQAGDYMGSYFLPDGTLGVIWTRRELTADAVVASAAVERSIYFARSNP